MESRIPENLDASDFKKFFFALVGWVFERGGEVYVLLVKKNSVSIPGALVIAHVTGVYMEPHCYWFPEASARNRLETALRFLIDMKSRYKLIIWSEMANWTFFQHICKYGVLRPIGKYRAFFPDGSDAMLFQSVN